MGHLHGSIDLFHLVGLGLGGWIAWRFAQAFSRNLDRDRRDEQSDLRQRDRGRVESNRAIPDVERRQADALAEEIERLR